jgi:hypothetical protein
MLSYIRFGPEVLASAHQHAHRDLRARIYKAVADQSLLNVTNGYEVPGGKGPFGALDGTGVDPGVTTPNWVGAATLQDNFGGLHGRKLPQRLTSLRRHCKKK